MNRPVRYFSFIALLPFVVHAVEIGGVVTGPKGPEAGVWVIAETTDLPTKYAKVVVTDEKGRYLIPELPEAKYTVWVRGYGLVDSAKVTATPGKTLNLKAVAAPSEKEAAEYYPGMYWYSMLNIPAKDQFPGTGEKGNGISPIIKTQEAWVDAVKNSCQSCHALGSKGIRTVPKVFQEGSTSSVHAWGRRTQAGQAMTNMALTLGYIGADAALKNFADWTDRIAAGELPSAKPRRPEGVERNVVVTMWDFSSPKHYLHDGISSYQHDPRVNANGPIYGSPEESTDNIPVLDPVKHRAYTIKHPVQSETPSSTSLPMQPSAYWGDKPIWDGASSIHNNMMDGDGRVWFSARFRPAANPDFCKKGSDHPSAKVMPLEASPRQLSVYDPNTQKWLHVDTCFPTHHLYFAKDAERTLWLSQGGLQAGVVGWVKTKTFLETGDSAKSQGWTPIVVDTNGNGKRDEFVGPADPVDPAKDKRLLAGFYGIMPSTVDDSVWGQTMGQGFARYEQPGFIIRLVPGPNPAETALAEVYVPPEGAWSPRGIDMTTDGVVWTPLASGHIASFERKKCKGRLNGPEAASGKLCPEGWTLFKMPGPQFKGMDASGSANHAYYIWVDRFNTLGLGKNVPIASTNGGESLMAVVNGKIVDIRVPYPLGFFTKLVDGRIDDPNAGWKGKGLWTMSGTRAVFHNEGGTENSPKVYKVQVRPNPLAK
ncbi:MAG: hypothetical protein QOD26_3093 [Betaproteobacteria bacterium]|jgi:hypothetical protein|nr:hypothetical protein [Betaproteobacteria bacterium]